MTTHNKSKPTSHYDPVKCAEDAQRRSTTKLNPTTVRDIRRAAAQGVRTAQLAAKYGVSKNTIRNVVRRAQWSNIS